MRVVTLTMNGQEVSGRDDESILQVARQHQISIPTLCQLDGLSVWGGCRMCMVQVEGTPSCWPAVPRWSAKAW